jgi:hypothetical protein
MPVPAYDIVRAHKIVCVGEGTVSAQSRRLGSKKKNSGARKGKLESSSTVTVCRGTHPTMNTSQEHDVTLKIGQSRSSGGSYPGSVGVVTWPSGSLYSCSPCFSGGSPQ